MRGWRNGGGRGCVGAVGDVLGIQTANGDRQGAVKCVRAGKNADHVAPGRIGYRANHRPTGLRRRAPHWIAGGLRALPRGVRSTQRLRPTPTATLTTH